MVSYDRRPERFRKAFRSLKRNRKRFCHWCRRPLAKPTSPCGRAYTRDHVMPRALGGRRTVPCCRACNAMKGDMHPSDWRKFMEANPKWWRNWKGADHG